MTTTNGTERLADWNLFCDVFTRLWVAERKDRTARFSGLSRGQVVWLATRYEASR